MLRNLSIRNVVLIGRLDLTFQTGLCVLTGETGAGKSILMDALGLALGARAEQRLIRHGADQATVSADFHVPAGHETLDVLAEAGLEPAADGIILRRVLESDGRSRAFINDQPVSVSLLKRVGQSLVEIHGQFENQRLLDVGTHRGLLDSFGNHKALSGKTAQTWGRWSAATQAVAEAEAVLARARADEDFLRHAVKEITALDPKLDEEDHLAEQRALMMHGEKIIEALNEAATNISRRRGVEGNLRSALRSVERVAARAEGRLDGVIAALDKAAEETAVAVALLTQAAEAVDLDPHHLEAVEERLFALKALARKHGADVASLPALAEKMSAELQAVDDGGVELARMKAEETAARAAFVEAANRLSKARRAAAGRLDTAIAAELKPLKLGKAVFSTTLDPLDEKDWGEHGRDRIVFQVATNPGQPLGPLGRIASGGELARFMLAIKAVLAAADPVPTIVFDEVDSGIGGAVSAAVGERLARLAGDVQVLVVTHSPQVAAVGAYHLRVSKSEADSGVQTTVDAITDATRTEEIARMLAGARITDEARAAAKSLLEGRPL